MVFGGGAMRHSARSVRSAAPRHQTLVKDGEWHTIYHFTEAADADAFAKEFGGERLPVGREGIEAVGLIKVVLCLF